MLNDFLWHKVSEKEKEEIRQNAKEIMDSFSKELEKVAKEKTLDEGVVERDECEREDGNSENWENKGFRDIMFENAPKKNKDTIVAEKGGWT